MQILLGNGYKIYSWCNGQWAFLMLCYSKDRKYIFKFPSHNILFYLSGPLSTEV